MAREFNRMLERISRDQQRRRQLLSAVSHELRTPLAVAGGHLELFETLGPPDGTSPADTAAVVRRELDHVGRIVDDLTAVSRGDLGGATAREPVFAPDMLTTLRHRLDGLGIGDVQFARAPSVVLLGDEDRLAQALLNLVVNARTYTPIGTPVHVRAHSGGGRVIFQVIDEGRGIDPTVLASVFEPFVTTRPAGASRATGLGPTVVKAVTEAQGGQVDLVTALGARPSRCPSPSTPPTEIAGIASVLLRAHDLSRRERTPATSERIAAARGGGRDDRGHRPRSASGRSRAAA